MPLLPSGHPGQQHCIRILDFFALPWPGGPEIPEEGDPAEHYAEGVVVLERAGPSLAAWQRAQANPFVSIPIVRKIIRQVLLALDYLHDGLPGYGIEHTGASLTDALLDIAGNLTLLSLQVFRSTTFCSLSHLVRLFWLF